MSESIGDYRRRLPMASDRDRIAAAVYASEKVAARMNRLAVRRKLLWISYVHSDGRIESVSA